MFYESQLYNLNTLMKWCCKHSLPFENELRLLLPFNCSLFFLCLIFNWFRKQFRRALTTIKIGKKKLGNGERNIIMRIMVVHTLLTPIVYVIFFHYTIFIRSFKKFRFVHHRTYYTVEKFFSRRAKEKFLFTTTLSVVTKSMWRRELNDTYLIERGYTKIIFFYFTCHLFSMSFEVSFRYPNKLIKDTSITPF